MGRVYQSIEVDKHDAKPDEGIPRRNTIAAKAAWERIPGKPHVTTLYELFKEGCKEFSNHNLMAQRDFIKIHNENKEITKKVDGQEVKETRLWQYYEMGQYRFQTFAEVEERVHQIASGLVHLGLEPGVSRFHIYCRTSSEWMQTALACCTQNMTFVTAYDTLGIEGLSSSISETETKGILAEREHLPTLVKVLPDIKTNNLVVYRDSQGELDDEQKEALHKLEELGVKVIPFSKVVQLGKENPAKPTPPKPKDVACIMYTSGTSGKPRGVVLLQKTVLAGVTGAVGNVTRKFVNSADVFLCVLPLAHIFEFTAELATLYWGACLGYSNPKTISDVNMRNCVGDIRELRPTILVAVPALWETVKKGIISQVSKQPAFLQKVFWSAFNFKAKLKSWGLPVPLVDSLIFKKIKQATGGRLRYTMNGGAALSRSTRVFLDVVIAPCIIGYGLTETNAMAAIMSPDHVEYESSGALVPSVTVKLKDVPDVGYFAKNGQGEVLIRGACVCDGYFKNEEETKAAFTDDGWFMTGDIGEWASNGTLLIIDRKKNMVKTSNGEYIAIERLESVYRENSLVNNICVVVDSDHAKPIAVIVIHEGNLIDLCKEKGIEYHHGIANQDKTIHRHILKAIQETGRNGGLKSAEILTDVTFSDEEWTPQNEFVTSAQKLKRKMIQDANKEGIKKAFENS